MNCRLLRPWGFPGRNALSGCHCLLQETVFIFETSEWLFRVLSGSVASGLVERQAWEAHLTVAGEVHTGVCRQPGGSSSGLSRAPFLERLHTCSRHESKLHICSLRSTESCVTLRYFTPEMTSAFICSLNGSHPLEKPLLAFLISKLGENQRLKVMRFLSEQPFVLSTYLFLEH